MNNIIHNLRRSIQKTGIKFYRVVNPSRSPRMNESERKASCIFRKLLKDPESELLTSSLSEKYYIRSHDKLMLLVLENYQISISDHVCGYAVSLSEKSRKILIETFMEESEKRRNQMEEEYKNNFQHSLNTIIKKLNEK
jgi:hypothetical protein